MRHPGFFEGEREGRALNKCVLFRRIVWYFRHRLPATGSWLLRPCPHCRHDLSCLPPNTCTTACIWYQTLHIVLTNKWVYFFYQVPSFHHNEKHVLKFRALSIEHSIEFEAFSNNSPLNIRLSCSNELFIEYEAFSKELTLVFAFQMKPWETDIKMIK